MSEPEPSHAEGDERPKSLNELSDEWGLCRPPCAKPGNHDGDCNTDMPLYSEGVGRRRAIEAAFRGIPTQYVESDRMRWKIAEGCIDDAIASGGVMVSNDLPGLFL